MTFGIDHVFLTRFNLPSEGAESLIRAREDWLVQRVELFQRYTLPSMAAQTCRDFSWIVYFDPESPAWLKQLAASCADRGVFVPLYRTRVDPEALVADIRSVTGAQGRELLTTNLDNDDGLSNDFVARLQSAPVRGPRTAVYLRHGLIKSPDGLFFRDDPVNAFCSVREAWADEPLTCWTDWHNMLDRHMPVIRVAGGPAWLQVIHTNNVSNRVRGRLVSPAAYRSTFGALVEDAIAPTRARLARDTLVDRPGRALREWSRGTVKKAIVTVGGKKGLDRVKLVRERISARSQ